MFYVENAVQGLKNEFLIPQQANTGVVEKSEKKKFVFLCHYKGTLKRKELSDGQKIIFNKVVNRWTIVLIKLVQAWMRLLRRSRYKPVLLFSLFAASPRNAVASILGFGWRGY